MSSFRIITLRSVFGTDQQTRQWMARARTVETRTEIRRWARWESVSFWLLLLGGICVFAAPVLGLASGIWSAFDDQAPAVAVVPVCSARRRIHPAARRCLVRVVCE